MDIKICRPVHPGSWKAVVSTFLPHSHPTLRDPPALGRNTQLLFFLIPRHKLLLFQLDSKARFPTACKPCMAWPPPGAPTPWRPPTHLCQPLQPLEYVRLLSCSLQALHMLFPRPAVCFLGSPVPWTLSPPPAPPELLCVTPRLAPSILLIETGKCSIFGYVWP